MSSKTEKLYTEKGGEYLQRNSDWHVGDSPWKAQQILKMLERNELQLKSISEVGCGAGEILNQLHAKLPKEIEYTGFDISADAIELAKPRAKERLHFKLEDFIETASHFDLNLMIDVFEHVDDYLGFLRNCRSKSTYSIFHIPLDMHVQGILRLHPTQLRKNLGHLHYYTRETALATLEDAGYEIIDEFFTAGHMDLQTSLKAKIKGLPRSILAAINKPLAVRIFGGFSLLVLTRN